MHISSTFPHILAPCNGFSSHNLAFGCFSLSLSPFFTNFSSTNARFFRLLTVSAPLERVLSRQISRRGITRREEERRRRIFKSKLAALSSCFFFSLSLSLSLSLYRLEIHFHRERRTRTHIKSRYSFRASRYERKTRRKRSRPTTTSRFRGRQSRRAPRRSRRSGGEISQGRRFAFGDEKRRHRGRAGFEFKNRTVEKLGRRGGTIGFARRASILRSFSRLFFVCFGDRCERDVLRRRHDETTFYFRSSVGCAQRQCGGFRCATR